MHTRSGKGDVVARMFGKAVQDALTLGLGMRGQQRACVCARVCVYTLLRPGLPVSVMYFPALSFACNGSPKQHMHPTHTTPHTQHHATPHTPHTPQVRLGRGRAVLAGPVQWRREGGGARLHGAVPGPAQGGGQAAAAGGGGGGVGELA